MTPQEIEKLFFEAIQPRGIHSQLTGISEDKIYNWRKGRGSKPHVGEMLQVLYQLNLIKVTHEPSRIP